MDVFVHYKDFSIFDNPHAAHWICDILQKDIGLYHRVDGDLQMILRYISGLVGYCAIDCGHQRAIFYDRKLWEIESFLLFIEKIYYGKTIFGQMLIKNFYLYNKRQIKLENLHAFRFCPRGQIIWDLDQEKSLHFDEKTFEKSITKYNLFVDTLNKFHRDFTKTVFKCDQAYLKIYNWENLIKTFSWEVRPTFPFVYQTNFIKYLTRIYKQDTYFWRGFCCMKNRVIKTIFYITQTNEFFSWVELDYDIWPRLKLRYKTIDFKNDFLPIIYE